MPGLGTLINMSLIVAGGIVGLIFGNRLPERYQDTLMKANGSAVLFVAIAGALSEMLSVDADGSFSTQGTLMMTVSLAIGSVIGELCNLSEGMERFGIFLREKTGNAKDNRFIDGFVTASLTVCIGAMAVIGSIQDGVNGDHSILIAKGILDAVIIMVMTASMGKGCIFSAIPVGIFQGVITLLATFLAPYITDAAMSNLSLVGSVMIFCIGVNLIWNTKIRVANMLPGLIVAVVWSTFG